MQVAASSLPQLLEPVTLGRDQAVTLAAIDFVALDPVEQSLGYAADLRRNRFNSGPEGWILGLDHASIGSQIPAPNNLIAL